MRRTPSHSDKDDYFDEDDVYETKYTQKYSHERQQTMDDLTNKNSSEHPEIPKIKRASRSPDIDSPALTQANRRPRLNKPREHAAADAAQSTRRRPEARESTLRKDQVTRRGPQELSNERKNPPTVRRRPKVYIEGPAAEQTTPQQPENNERVRDYTTRRQKNTLNNEVSEASTARRRPRVSNDDEPLSETTPPRRPRVPIDDEPPNRAAPPRRPRVYIDDDEPLSQALSPRRPRTPIDDESTASTRRPRRYIEELPAEQATPRPSKSTQEQKKRYTFVYNLPTVQVSRERIDRRARHSQQILWDRWQIIRRNRPLMISISAILILSIIIPLTINLIAHPSAGSKQVLTNIGPGSQAQSTATPQIMNGREIVITPPNNNHPAPPLLATSGYLIDADTGATLYAKNPFMHISPMSTTKLMTVLLAVEHGNLDQQVTINASITNDLNNDLSADSALMGIKPGETYTMRQLLYGLLLVSGNDAAIAVADTVAGTVPKFADEMNQKAKQLGMNDTHFLNPHGLIEPGHYSSAHDLAVLGVASLTNTTVQQISATKEYKIAATNQHAAHDMLNEDQFMYWYPGVEAGKTGWDNAANFLQVIYCKRNNRRLIAVVMHTDDWWTDVRDLMNYGFSDFTWISPREINASDYAIPWADEWSYFRIDQRTRTIPMGSQGRFYIYTEYAISGQIMSYFDKNHGLTKFGYPIGPVSTADKTSLSQRFQHASIQCDIQTKQCKTL